VFQSGNGINWTNLGTNILAGYNFPTNALLGGYVNGSYWRASWLPQPNHVGLVADIWAATASDIEGFPHTVCYIKDFPVLSPLAGLGGSGSFSGAVTAGGGFIGNLTGVASQAVHATNADTATLAFSGSAGLTNQWRLDATNAAWAATNGLLATNGNGAALTGIAGWQIGGAVAEAAHATNADTLKAGATLTSNNIYAPTLIGAVTLAGPLTGNNGLLVDGSGYLHGNGAALTGLTGSQISGAVAQADHATNADNLAQGAILNSNTVAGVMTLAGSIATPDGSVTMSAGGFVGNGSGLTDLQMTNIHGGQVPVTALFTNDSSSGTATAYLLGGTIFPGTVSSNQLDAATFALLVNGGAGSATNMTLAVNPTGITNTLPVRYELDGFSGNSVICTNYQTAFGWVVGTVANVPQFVLQSGDALIGTACSSITNRAF
jgi:hypothetical protein